MSSSDPTDRPREPRPVSGAGGMQNPTQQHYQHGIPVPCGAASEPPDDDRQMNGDQLSVSANSPNQPKHGSLGGNNFSTATGSTERGLPSSNELQQYVDEVLGGIDDQAAPRSLESPSKNPPGHETVASEGSHQNVTPPSCDPTPPARLLPLPDIPFWSDKMPFPELMVDPYPDLSTKEFPIYEGNEDAQLEWTRSAFDLARRILPLGFDLRQPYGDPANRAENSRPMLGICDPNQTLLELREWYTGVQPSTRKIYAARMKAIVRGVLRDDGIALDEVTAVVGLQTALDWCAKKSRVYKAAFAYHMCIFMLERADPFEVFYLYIASEAMVVPQNGMSERKKHPYATTITDNDYWRLMNALRLSDSALAPLTMAVLSVTRKTAVRPGETWDMKAEYDTSSGAPVVTIVTRNSKWVPNGNRADGPRRYLTYPLSPNCERVEAVTKLLEEIEWLNEQAKGTTLQEWRDILDKCQNLIRRLRLNIWGQDLKKGQRLPIKRRYAIYTMRHQSCADMLATLMEDGVDEGEARIIVAAIMGQASSETAAKHYAHPKHGTRMPHMPEPDPESVLRVRHRWQDAKKRIAKMKAEVEEQSAPKPFDVIASVKKAGPR